MPVDFVNSVLTNPYITYLRCLWASLGMELSIPYIAYRIPYIAYDIPYTVYYVTYWAYPPLYWAYLPQTKPLQFIR